MKKYRVAPQIGKIRSYDTEKGAFEYLRSNKIRGMILLDYKCYGSYRLVVSRYGEQIVAHGSRGRSIFRKMLKSCNLKSLGENITQGHHQEAQYIYYTHWLEES